MSELVQMLGLGMIAAGALLALFPNTHGNTLSSTLFALRRRSRAPGEVATGRLIGLGLVIAGALLAIGGRIAG